VDFYGLTFDATSPGVIFAFLVSALVWGLVAGGIAVVVASVSTRRAG
jgi:hypothetical protein